MQLLISSQQLLGISVRNFAGLFVSYIYTDLQADIDNHLNIANLLALAENDALTKVNTFADRT